MVNNQAFCATLKNIRKIEGADRIVQADVTLNDIVITSIVTGVDTKENTPVVYFDSNMCLSDKMIETYPELKTYLRIESKNINVFKLKSERFYLKESEAKDKGEDDIEEQEAVIK